MDLKQLEALVGVIECGSFSKAALSLYLTQPTVSAHISSLERELGAVLLLRTTKEVVPSAQGKLLYGYAKQMLRLRDEAEAALADEELEANRTISIATPASVCGGILSEMISTYSMLQPRVTINACRLASDAAEREVLKGSLQFAIVVGKPNNPKLKCHAAFPGKIVVALSAESDLPNVLSAQQFAELASSSTLYLEKAGSGGRRQAERYLRKIGVEPAVKVAHSVETALAAVAQGKGAAVVCLRAVQTYAYADKLRYAELEDATRFWYYVVTHRSYMLSPQAKNALKFVKRRLAEMTDAEQSSANRPAL